MRWISWLAANQLAAQEGLCTREWVSEWVTLHVLFLFFFLSSCLNFPNLGTSVWCPVYILELQNVTVREVLYLLLHYINRSSWWMRMTLLKKAATACPFIGTLLKSSQICKTSRVCVAPYRIHERIRNAQWLRQTFGTIQRFTPNLVNTNTVFFLHNPSGRTMALGSTQPLREMTKR